LPQQKSSIVPARGRGPRRLGLRACRPLGKLGSRSARVSRAGASGRGSAPLLTWATTLVDRKTCGADSSWLTRSLPKHDAAITVRPRNGASRKSLVPYGPVNFRSQMPVPRRLSNSRCAVRGPRTSSSRHTLSRARRIAAEELLSAQAGEGSAPPLSRFNIAGLGFSPERIMGSDSLISFVFLCVLCGSGSSLPAHKRPSNPANPFHLFDLARLFHPLQGVVNRRHHMLVFVQVIPHLRQTVPHLGRR
jgi:hypothetical protein